MYSRIQNLFLHQTQNLSYINHSTVYAQITAQNDNAKYCHLKNIYNHTDKVYGCSAEELGFNSNFLSYISQFMTTLQLGLIMFHHVSA